MAKQHPIPGWLYESLPFIYVAAGVFVALELANIWGIGSGALLVSAGMLVWWTRHTYRRAARQSPTPPLRETVVLGYDSASGLTRLVWDKGYECGHPTIDAQHRRLFELGNAFLAAILEQKPKLDVELLLDELVSEVAKHFLTEEQLLAEVPNALTPEHQDAHDMLLTRCREMAVRFHNDHLKVGDLFRFVAQEVVSGHVLAEDLKVLAIFK